MFRNVLAATLRNLARNRLYAAISVLSLAIGMAAAILTFLFVRDELTFDRSLPGHERLFVVQTRLAAPGEQPETVLQTIAPLASWMRLGFPEVRRVARYASAWVYVRQGDSSVYQNVGWVDPGFFRVIGLKTLAGDPDATMRRPDGLVLTRSMARRYFGVDAPLGRTLFVQKVPAPGKLISGPLTVGAVIEDPPSNTNIVSTVFASGLGRLSPQTEADAEPYVPGTKWLEFRTFVQLADARQAAAVDRRLAALVRQRMFPPPVLSETPVGKTLAMSLAPIARMHLIADPTAEVPPANSTLLSALTAIALMILLAAGLNFVNLATARAARRATEVGVRKVSGAARRHLVLQFLGESLVYAAIAGVLAVALAEAGLPALDSLLQRSIRFPYWHDPGLIGLIAGLILLVGLAAGLYPALVLSAFRPSTAFRPVAADGRRQGLRRALVVVQFALLIGLLSSILVIADQTRFALTKGTGLDTDQVVVTGGPSCRSLFADRLRRIAGVKGMACSSRTALGRASEDEPIRTPDGRTLTAGVKTVDWGFFELYGLRPLAGRLPDRARGGDGTAFGDGWAARPRGTVVNQAMVRALGLGSPEAAIGAVFQAASRPGRYLPLQIIGVIPDYAFDLTKGPVEPAYFPVVPDADADLSFKVAADHIPETIAAVEAAWKASGSGIPLLWRFNSEYLNQVYAGVIRQAWLIGALAGVAVLIAAMGLFGTAAFVAEQRTKEIGVRKAMGASTPDILRLMLWSFGRPVLLANLIAWPVAWLVLARWLEGFARHIPLQPWMFLAAAAAALAVALATVLAHTLRVAAAKPALALRYE
jgi:putative ABC transport system permease protein